MTVGTAGAATLEEQLAAAADFDWARGIVHACARWRRSGRRRHAGRDDGQSHGSSHDAEANSAHGSATGRDAAHHGPSFLEVTGSRMPTRPGATHRRYGGR